MKNAQRTLRGTARHAAEQRCIAEFVGTPYGVLARNKLMGDGKVCVPLFASEQEARTKTSSMVSAVARLVEDTDGAVKSVMLKRRYTKIKGQDRLVVPLSHLGTDFGTISGEMEDTLVYVLWALDNPGYDRIIAEISTCLLSLEGLLAQVKFDTGTRYWRRSPIKWRAEHRRRLAETVDLSRLRIPRCVYFRRGISFVSWMAAILTSTRITSRVALSNARFRVDGDYFGMVYPYTAATVVLLHGLLVSTCFSVRLVVRRRQRGK
ncbi:unnamed protein product [Ectocarpus sp. 12 AP-2014]